MTDADIDKMMTGELEKELEKEFDIFTAHYPTWEHLSPEQQREEKAFHFKLKHLCPQHPHVKRFEQWACSRQPTSSW